jgi:hypothetical protein
MKITMCCDKCGGQDLRISWQFKNDKDYQQAYLCHDGWGLEITDAAIVCTSCNHEMMYKTDMVSAFRQDHGVGFKEEK